MTRGLIISCCLALTVLCATMTQAGAIYSVGTELQSRSDVRRQTFYMFIDGAPECGFGLGGLTVGNDTFGKVYIGPIGKFYDFAEAGISIGYGNEGQRPSRLYAFGARLNLPLGGRTVSTNYFQEHSTATWQRGEFYTDIAQGVTFGLTTQTDLGTGPRLEVTLPGQVKIWDTAMNRRSVWTNVASVSVAF